MLNFVNTGGGPPRALIPVAPLINVLFLLAMFFVLSWQIAAPTANEDVNLPIGAAAADETAQLTGEIRVKLQADAAGRLMQVTLGETPLGHDDRAFEQLHREILKRIPRPGAARTQKIEVEIDADYDLRYEYVIQAVSQCTGRSDSHGNLIRYVDKVKFAPAKKPHSG